MVNRIPDTWARNPNMQIRVENDVIDSRSRQMWRSRRDMPVQYNRQVRDLTHDFVMPYGSYQWHRQQVFEPIAQSGVLRNSRYSRPGRSTMALGWSKAADMGTCWFCALRDRVKYALEWAQNIMFTLSVAVAAFPLSWASTSRPAPAAFCSEAVPVWNTIVVLRTSTAAPPDGSSPGRQHAAILAPSPVKGTH